MAGLSSPGIGSGLDINGLVEKLVAAERAPRQAQITRAQTSTVTTISALGQLKGALGAFQNSLSQLSTLDTFSSRSAVSSDVEVFTATATSTAAPGSYDIEVVHLASAHQVSSQGFASGSSHVVGTGTLTIGLGLSTFQVSVPQTAQTLAGIRDAINTAPSNNLVRATIVNGSDGAHLVLTSQVAGASNTISVAASGGNGGLAALNYTTLAPGAYTQPREARSAEVNVAGVTHTSNSNTISGLIDGVEITLLEADEGETHTLRIENDTSTVQSKIANFVAEFNSLAGTIGQLRSYEPETKKAGPLLGDALLRSIETEVRGKLTDRVSGLTGNFQSLASIGITTNRDGTMTLDSAKLKTALNQDYNGVAAMFAAENGIAARLKSAIEPRLSATSELNVRTKALNTKSVDLQKELAALDTRMAAASQRYLKQFNALDTLLSQLQNTSTFLTQQLSNVAKISIDRD
jgi:flagellar hook-associated protein 2